MPSLNRLALIRSRFAALSGAVIPSAIDSFRPVPAARHSFSCLGGGVVFRTVAETFEPSDLAADFVAPTVDPIVPAIDPEMDHEIAPIARAWADFEIDAISESNKLLLMP